MNRRALACEWLRLGTEDLRFAEAGLEHGLEPRYIAFHAQQAVEKAVKAVLVAIGRVPPKTHDLEVLIDLLSRSGVDVSYLYEIDADMLSDYATTARYPGPPVNAEEAEASVEIAGKALEWARKTLIKLGVEC